ncbi:hypothetical protein BGX26_010999 [Mortierella sp. AD094]|nr:hypothetical protein BGX26_010999 [Mortierella sp. AD094]
MKGLTSPNALFHNYLFIICAYLTSIISLSNAQGPALVSDMAYATVAERTLYIQGGMNLNVTGSAYNQLYSLDLTTNWTNFSPPWKALSTQSAPSDSHNDMAVSADKSSLIVWGYVAGISTYNIAGNSWSTVTNTQPASILPTFGKHIAADPRTGIIYKLASKSNLTTDPQIFVAYDPATNTSQLPTLPPALATTELRYHSLVWSTQRNSILPYGGRLYPSNQYNTIFYEYQPVTNSWSELNTTGSLPGILYSHCMIPAYGGTKMILFGGNQAGDYYSVLSTPIIYSLKDSKWTTQYIVSTPMDTPAPTNPVDSPSKSGGGTAPIIGGVVAGVLVLAIAGFFIHRRSKLAKGGHERSTAVEIEGGRGHGIKLTNGSDISSVSQQPEAVSLNKQSPLPEQEFGTYQD